MEACKLLLKHGADANHKDIYGRSPRDVAEKAGNSKLLALLSRPGGTTLSPSLERRQTAGASPVSNNTTSSSQNSTDEKTKTTNTSSGYNSVGLNTVSSESPNLSASRYFELDYYRNNSFLNTTFLELITTVITRTVTPNLIS